MELDGASRSGLAWAALGLVNRPTSAAELVDLLAGDGAVVTVQRSQELLTELMNLGLIWVAETEAPQVRYVRTPIGNRLAHQIAADNELRVGLRELERLRSNLFTAVAHELRTPLTAIRTAVGLLLDPATRAAPVQRQQLLQTIERNAERLQRLTDDALELARFRAGELRLQLRRFDAREVGDAVQVAMAPLLQAKGQRMVLELGSRPVWVFADHRRIERAVLNLVANAHKFSGPGVDVRLTVSQRGDDVTWEVMDGGPGISETEQSRLFERFFVSPSARSEGGSGLGLPIVLASAQAHGGRVEVDSEIGRGSRFRMVVPAAGPRNVDR
jgi:signal transduction histidine kinase